jgi:hypothetical protein
MMAKPEPFLALVRKKNLFNTSLNGPPKNTSPESFLVGTGALFTLPYLCPVPHSISFCSLKCSLRHSILSSTSKKLQIYTPSSDFAATACAVLQLM